MLVLGAALIGGLLWLAAGGLFRPHVDLFMAVEQESVAGLNPSAPVKYNGVDVGDVHSISLDPHNPERVLLLFAIERGTPIKADTVAMLKTQGLTGIAYVELSGGTVGSPPLRARAGQPYPIIQTRPSLSARLENILTSVLAKLDHTSANVDAVLSDANRRAFSNALADIALIAHTIAARREHLDAALVNTARTMDNTARGTADLGPVIARIGRGADALRSMSVATEKAAQTQSTAVADVSADVHRMTTETIPDLQRTLAELEALTVSLRRLTEQTERNPTGLLLQRGAVPPGPGEPGYKRQEGSAP